MIPRRAEHYLCLLLWPLVLSASGCKEVVDEPCFGLRLEESLEIHVVSEYSEAAGYDFNLGGNPVAPLCPASLRLPADNALGVRVVAQEEQGLSQSCLPNIVEVTGGSGLELGARAPWLAFGSESISEILHATQELTIEGCVGRTGISVESRSGSYGAKGNPFLSAPTSGYPPIIMYFGFKADDRDTPACSQLLGGQWNCTDHYVVELSRP